MSFATYDLRKRKWDRWLRYYLQLLRHHLSFYSDYYLAFVVSCVCQIGFIYFGLGLFSVSFFLFAFVVYSLKMRRRLFEDERNRFFLTSFFTIIAIELAYFIIFRKF